MLTATGPFLDFGIKVLFLKFGVRKHSIVFGSTLEIFKLASVHLPKSSPADLIFYRTRKILSFSSPAERHCPQ